MKRFALMLAAVCCCGPAVADRLFSDGFEIPVIEPLFPRANGTFLLPPGPTTDQLVWIMGELASGETTTPEEIMAHFDPSWGVSIPDTQAFFETLRTTFPDAIIRDVVAVTPVEVTVVISKPDLTTPYGFLSLQAHYSGAQGILQFGVSDYFGSVQYPEDQNLDLADATTKFTTLSSAPALMVGRIDASTGQCSAIVDVNASELRATGSLFKLWVLGGVARDIALGELDLNDPVPLVASAIAPGGTINNEPLGTVFPVIDMARLMIGISDNTATDHLHHLVGRDRIDEVIDDYDVADPTVLKPLLDISEQFHLFFSFPLDTSLAYVNGTEEYQQQFLDDEIVPLGPYVPGSGQYNNVELLTSGSWRASPMDICNAFAHHLRLPQGSDAAYLVDQALGAQSAQPEVRNAWDRVWYKGGSLSAADGYHVLTHAWMLQNSGEDPYVVIAMSNSDTGGIDEYEVQSITGRILQLVSEMP
jgi:Beta-lactamase enzyme family